MNTSKTILLWLCLIILVPLLAQWSQQVALCYGVLLAAAIINWS